MNAPRHDRAWIWRGPFIVWLALMVLLGLTAFLGYLPMGGTNAAVNFPIAALMVALLAIFLMRLRNAQGVVWLAALSGLVFLFIMFLLTFGDYFNR
jgi:caa(3)-type oxidase subunit IV